MSKQKQYNAQMEKLNLRGTKAERRKKYKHITEELGARLITLKDVAGGLEGKQRGFIDMMDQTGMTMDDLVILQQYSKAIIDRDTKSAEFLRDTRGDKPSTQLDITDTTNGISQLSDDELRELIEELKKSNG